MIRYSIDGHDLGVAFEGVARGAETTIGWTPAASLTRNSSARFNLGETQFSFPPPDGYISVVEAAGMASTITTSSTAAAPSGSGGSKGAANEAKSGDEGLDENSFEDDFVFVPPRPKMLVRHPTQPKWATVDSFPLLWGAAPPPGMSSAEQQQLASVCTGEFM